jgi:hypothetical protein
MSDRLAVRERLAAIDCLEATAIYLNRLAAWLSEAGAETESDMTNEAAKSLLAACWFISRPLRQPVPPERWPGTGTEQPVPYQQAPDQQR